ncbi:MAG TPA: hypothetical protein QGF58_09290, partial [Myxococcota bacterium]|nr:hypothetical protein [Myxococcota bacterium]
HAQVVGVLEKKLALADDDGEASQLLRSIAGLQDNELADADAATGTWQRILERSPGDPAAVAALVRLLTAASRWVELVDVLQAEADLHDDPADKRKALERIAEVWADQMEDWDKAIEAWSEILGLFPADREVVDRLADLCERAESWERLLEVLQGQDQLLTDNTRATDGPLDPDQAALKLRIGGLLEGPLDQVDRAIEVYRGLLERSPEHGGALAALETMLDRPDHRVEVARYLEPRYAHGDSWAKLVRTLEIQLSVMEGADPRAETILRIADLRASHLDDGAGAYELLADSLRAQPSDSRFADTLERQAAALQRWPDLVDLLRELAAERPGAGMSLLLRTVRIQQEELEDSKGALDACQEIIGLQPDDTHEGWADYLQGLSTAVSQTHDKQGRMGLLRRAAEVAEGQLSRPDEAADYCRRLLEEAPDDGPALDALEHLLRELGDHAQVVGVLEKKLALADDDGEASQLLRSIAGLQDNELADADAATGTW